MAGHGKGICDMDNVRGGENDHDHTGRRRDEKGMTKKMMTGK
jgi:hypothetical protein